MTEEGLRRSVSSGHHTSSPCALGIVDPLGEGCGSGLGDVGHHGVAGTRQFDLRAVALHFPLPPFSL